MQLKRNDKIINYPIPAFENISNPTLQQLTDMGFVEYIEPETDPLPVYIPNSITMRQARLQLSAINQYDAVNYAVSGMGLPAQIEWEYAATVDRDNPLTAAMVQLLSWTETQTDDYFTAASLL